MSPPRESLPSASVEALKLETLSQAAIEENSAGAHQALLNELNKLQRTETSNVENSTYLQDVNKELAKLGANPDPHIPTLDLQDGGGPAVINGKQTDKCSLLLHGEADGADLNAMTTEMAYDANGNLNVLPGSVDVYRAPKPQLPPVPPEQSPQVQKEARRLEQLAKADLVDPSAAHSKALVDELNSLRHQSSAYIEQIDKQFQVDGKDDPTVKSLSLSFWAINPMENIVIENPPVGELDLGGTLDNGKTVKQLSAYSDHTQAMDCTLTAGGTEVDNFNVIPQKDGEEVWEPTTYKVWKGTVPPDTCTQQGPQPIPWQLLGLGPVSTAETPPEPPLNLAASPFPEQGQQRLI